MPHYKDGSPAQVGDFVKGKPHNTPREILGEVLEVTAGETCNLKVAFIEKETPHESHNEPCATYAYLTSGRVRLRARTDYGETGAFEKIA